MSLSFVCIFQLFVDAGDGAKVVVSNSVWGDAA